MKLGDRAKTEPVCMRPKKERPLDTEGSNANRRRAKVAERIIHEQRVRACVDELGTL